MREIKMTKSEICLALKMIGVAAVMIALMLTSVAVSDLRDRYTWLRDVDMDRASAFDCALRGHGLTLDDRLKIWKVKSYSDKLHEPPKGARW